MPKQLFFFTSAYPYGQGEMWKTTELAAFVRHFDKVTIIPFSYNGNPEAKAIPDEVMLAEPVIKDFRGLKKHFLSIFFSRRILFYLNEFFSRVIIKKSWYAKWLLASVYTEFLFKHPLVEQLVNNDQFGKASVLYFFWGSENSYIIPFLNQAKFKKIVVRFHGYDLYEERKSNAGYIPFRRQLLKGLTDAVFISQNGMDYLGSKYPDGHYKRHLFRLGALEHGLASTSRDQVLRIYTCSMLVPVKRLHLLAEALQYSSLKIQWHHIGSGSELDKIMNGVAKFPSNVTFINLGFIAPDKVVSEYIDRPVDLFINVSESEGVPVSIMEAMSAGIPIIATDVGGTSEIVNQEIGFLIDKDIAPKDLCKKIEDFYMLSEEQKAKLRAAARKRFTELWDAKVNSETFSAFLSS